MITTANVSGKPGPAPSPFAASMLDRLLHHCHTVVTDGDSFRMRQARVNGGTRLKTS